ncbi:DUF6883 domain-containing protein [Aerosakkonemataceae cyanobacterium BLCC-F50]|uniref:DUF6883 domain-containing protein n=1 Tax=Floridaenema flaviceps BLCC-F50 TaxID=3153642 RepID=A0ABV4Y011_9CYAN
MKLSPDAIIAQAKLTQYLLKLLPQDDKSKFLAQAGYTQENWQQLEKDLREQILPLDALFTEQTRFGNHYKIRGTLTGVKGVILPVVTIWIIEKATGQTKFITLFPDKEV